MMMDGKGAAAIFGIATAICLFLGLLVMWIFDLPWWAPLVAAALPAGLAALLFLFIVISWMASGSR